MDEDDAEHNVFRSDQLWKGSSLFATTNAYESALFHPIELDSRFCRVLCSTMFTRRATLTVYSRLGQIRPPVCAET